MPPLMPEVQEQYQLGPEVMEISDPSFQTEEAFRIAHYPPSLPYEISGRLTAIIKQSS